MTEATRNALRQGARVAGFMLAIAFAAAWVLVGLRETLTACMVVQPYVSALLGLAIVVYLVHRLLCCAAQYSSTEKFGMSMTAAGMVMATPALWLNNTPFDGWSFNVARFGIALFIVTGGLRRDRHRARNLHQQAYAEGWRDGRAGSKGSPTP